MSIIYAELSPSVVLSVVVPLEPRIPQIFHRHGGRWGDEGSAAQAVTARQGLQTERVRVDVVARSAEEAGEQGEVLIEREALDPIRPDPPLYRRIEARRHPMSLSSKRQRAPRFTTASVSATWRISSSAFCWRVALMRTSAVLLLSPSMGSAA